MAPFNPSRYAPAITDLLREPWTPPLDVGQPDPAVQARLSALSNEEAFAPHKIRDRAMADACRAGLWLYHNFLDEAHEIAQELHTPTGSYWHALMHRREPDFSNPMYPDLLSNKASKSPVSITPFSITGSCSTCQPRSRSFFRQGMRIGTTPLPSPRFFPLCG